jgi:hypothetical protein
VHIGFRDFEQGEEAVYAVRNCFWFLFYTRGYVEEEAHEGKGQCRDDRRDANPKNDASRRLFRRIMVFFGVQKYRLAPRSQPKHRGRHGRRKEAFSHKRGRHGGGAGRDTVQGLCQLLLINGDMLTGRFQSRLDASLRQGWDCLF